MRSKDLKVISEPKPEFPKVISIRVQNKEMSDWLLEVFTKKEAEIQIKIAKTQLMIQAIKTGDFSDLPPSCMKEIEDLKKKDEQETKSA